MRARWLLRTEGLVVALGAVWIYLATDGSLLLFALLILAPDLSMAGYLVDSRWGARAYNAVHTYVGPAVLGVGGIVTGVEVAVSGALVWATHVGVDRLFGFGLKYAGAAFADTHLQRV